MERKWLCVDCMEKCKNNETLHSKNSPCDAFGVCDVCEQCKRIGVYTLNNG